MSRKNRETWGTRLVRRPQRSTGFDVKIPTLPRKTREGWGTRLRFVLEDYAAGAQAIGAGAGGAALQGYAVDDAIDAERKCTGGLFAVGHLEGVHHRVLAGFSDLEKNPAAFVSYTTDITVGIASPIGRTIKHAPDIEQAQGMEPLRWIGEGPQYGERTACIQVEYFPLVKPVCGSTCYAVNVSIHIAQQASLGVAAVAATGEGMENREGARGVDLENGSETVGSVQLGRAVEIAGGVANEITGLRSVGGSGEFVDHRIPAG